MKKIKTIYKNLIKEYQTTNLVDITKSLGVFLRFSNLGKTQGIHYTVNIEDSTYNVIEINDNLDEYEQKYTLAHELGHFLLHSSTSVYFLRKYTNYKPTGIELEADLFASYFLVSDEEILEINDINYLVKNYKLSENVITERIKYIEK